MAPKTAPYSPAFPDTAHGKGTFYDVFSQLEQKATVPFYASEITPYFTSVCHFRNASPDAFINERLQQSTEFGTVHFPDTLYIPSANLFDGLTVAVCLTRDEIRNGLFVVERHLLPFLSRYSLPHECRMFWGDIEFAKIAYGDDYRLFREPSGYADDFLPLQSVAEKSHVSHTVFNLDGIYEKNGYDSVFSECLIRITDYRKGVFEIMFLSEEEQFIQRSNRNLTVSKIECHIEEEIRQSGILPNPFSAIRNFCAFEMHAEGNPPAALPELSMLFKACKNLFPVRFYNHAYVMTKDTRLRDVHEFHCSVSNPVDGRCENITDILVTAGSLLNENLVVGNIAAYLLRNIDKAEFHAFLPQLVSTYRLDERFEATMMTAFSTLVEGVFAEMLTRSDAGNAAEFELLETLLEKAEWANSSLMDEFPEGDFRFSGYNKNAEACFNVFVICDASVRLLNVCRHTGAGIPQTVKQQIQKNLLLIKQNECKMLNKRMPFNDLMNLSRL